MRKNLHHSPNQSTALSATYAGNISCINTGSLKNRYRQRDGMGLYLTRLSKIFVLVGILMLVGSKGWGQTSITAIGTPVTENFDELSTSGTWTDNETLSGWYARTDNTPSITEYLENDGTVTAIAGLYSFGLEGSNSVDDRAIGFVPSVAFTGTEGSGKGYIGWRLKNNTGKSIGTFQVIWSGEQWYKISAGVQNLVLRYQIGSSVTSLTTGTYTLAGSQFDSPITGSDGEEYNLDGNDANNRTGAITVELNVTIPAGSEIMLRWEDLMDPANHLLAIDDVSFNALRESQTISFGTLSARPFSNGSTFELTATASSSLTVSYSSNNPTVVSVSGTTATIHAAGQATITASQAGDNVFSPAPDVTQVQIIIPAAPIAIAATNVLTGSYRANWSASVGGAEEYWFYTSIDNFATTVTTGSVGTSLFATSSGLLPNTTYYYRIRAKAGTEYSDYSNIITVTTPAGIQTYNIVQSVNGFTSNTLTWQAGNHVSRIVFLREGTGSSCPDPVNNTNYTARSDWATKGTQLSSSGFYCIYKGTGTSVNLTNLYPGRTYTVEAFEFNSVSLGTAKFLTTVTGANNPITFAPWGTTTFTNTTPGQSSPEDWTTAARWDHATVPTAALHSAVLVYIDGNCEITTTATCNNLTINAANGGITPKLSINPTKSLTVSGTLTNAAGTSGLVLKSTSSGSGALLHTTAGVDATVERYIAGWTSGTDGWHFISSPVADQAIPTAFTVAPATDYDFFAYNEKDTYHPYEYWLNYKAGDFYTWNGGNNFVPGRGYLVAYKTADTKLFTGSLNVTDVTIPLTYTPTNTNFGWNLVGNPFTTGLTWGGSAWAGGNIYGTVKCLSSINASYSDISAGNVIPENNGFLVCATKATNLTIPASARVFGGTWIKKSNASEKFILTAHDLDGATAQSSNLCIIPDATTGFDREYDSEFVPFYAPQFYSFSENRKLSTNTLPDIKENTTIDYGFVKNGGTNFSITVSGIQSLPYTPYLTDKKTNTITDLSAKSEYTFTSYSNDDPNRFVLSFLHPTGIDKPVPAALRIYASAGILNISGAAGKGEIIVRNILGQVMLRASANGDTQQSVNSSNLPAGVYVVSVVSGKETKSQKVVISE